MPGRVRLFGLSDRGFQSDAQKPLWCVQIVPDGRRFMRIEHHWRRSPTHISGHVRHSRKVETTRTAEDHVIDSLCFIWFHGVVMVKGLRRGLYLSLIGE